MPSQSLNYLTIKNFIFFGHKTCTVRSTKKKKNKINLFAYAFVISSFTSRQFWSHKSILLFVDHRYNLCFCLFTLLFFFICFQCSCNDMLSSIVVSIAILFFPSADGSSLHQKCQKGKRTKFFRAKNYFVSPWTR